jgi:hypothetical protein
VSGARHFQLMIRLMFLPVVDLFNYNSRFLNLKFAGGGGI